MPGNDFSQISPLLQNLRLLSNLAALASPTIDFAVHLLYNFNTTPGHTDDKIAIGIGVPGPSGIIITGTKAEPFYAGLSDGTNSLKLTPSGALPISTTPSGSTLLGSKVVILSPPLTNQSSPVTVLTTSYTNVQANSTIEVTGALQVENFTTTTETTVDVEIKIGSTVYSTSRTFQATDIGSVTLFTRFTIPSVTSTTIALIASQSSGTSNNLSFPNAYIAITEST